MAEKRPLIYIVEDDESIRVLLAAALRAAGFEPREFPGAAEALDALAETLPAAVLMDIMMQGIDGITALKLIRQNPETAVLPVMMLTAKDTEGDKVLGLDSGADDYMTKPFSVLELCARVRALVRRTTSRPRPEVTSERLCAGELEVNLAVREVLLNGHPVELTLKEFELLRMLMQNSGRVVSRDELLQQVWGYEFVGETRTLDMHIGTLRHKLGDDGPERRFIKTVRGVGYRFLQDVTHAAC